MRPADGLRLVPAAAGSRLGIKAPYKLLLALTDRCNQRCTHCRIWNARARPEFTPDEIRRALQSLPSLRWVDLTGGEIFLRDDLGEVLDAVTGALPDLVFLHFPTNGSLPARILRETERVRSITRARIVVTVSVDGDAALHDRIRGVPGAFDAALETARNLDGLQGVDVFVGTTVTPENVDALDAVRDALVRRLPRFRPHEWHINLMTRSPHFFRNTGAAVPTSDRVLEVLPRLARLRGRPRNAFGWVERLYLGGLARFHRSGRPPAPCQALRASLFVDAGGDVYGSHILDTRLGNLRDAGFDLRAILDGPPARAERRRISEQPCTECWTPCEAYHAMLASPLRAFFRGLRM